MPALKASYHNGRVGDPNHNDRTFDISKASHIDPSKTSLNRYICVYPDMHFRDAELLFYERNFSTSLDIQNEKHIRHRHRNRIKTMDDIYNGIKTRPEETILQIGSIEGYPDPEILMSAYDELFKYSNHITHKHCKVLDAALHMDESTPHIHMRRVWIYETTDPEHGRVLHIGQEKALEQAGIPLPDPSKPVSRTNNRKITYDRLMREKWYEILRGKGIALDTRPYDRPHQGKTEYIAGRIEEERLRQEKKRDKNRQL